MINAGVQCDAFTLNGCQQDDLTINASDGPIDSMSIDDTLLPVAMPRTDISATTINRFWPADQSASYNLTYSGMEAIGYTAKSSTTSINVYGTPSSIPAGQQMTILCGSNADTVTLYPHDANGNLTINGNLGVSGGGGSDKVLVDDTGSANGINYVFTNTFGPGTQNINGLGTRGFGAASDVETIEIRGGDGEDTFTLNTWQSGAALIVNSGGGYDDFEISPTAQNLPAAITSMSFFNYDGGAGDDHFDVINANNTSAWTITRAATQLTYSAPSRLLSRHQPGPHRLPVRLRRHAERHVPHSQHARRQHEQ